MPGDVRADELGAAGAIGDIELKAACRAPEGAHLLPPRPRPPRYAHDSARRRRSRRAPGAARPHARFHDWIPSPAQSRRQSSRAHSLARNVSSAGWKTVSAPDARTSPERQILPSNTAIPSSSSDDSITSTSRVSPQRKSPAGAAYDRIPSSKPDPGQVAARTQRPPSRERRDCLRHDLGTDPRRQVPERVAERSTRTHDEACLQSTVVSVQDLVEQQCILPVRQQSHRILQSRQSSCAHPGKRRAHAVYEVRRRRELQLS